jgi:hypothetical protein
LGRRDRRTRADTAEPSEHGGRLRSLAVDLSPLRESRQFRLLFIGEAVSDLGSEITA